MSGLCQFVPLTNFGPGKVQLSQVTRKDSLKRTNGIDQTDLKHVFETRYL